MLIPNAERAFIDTAKIAAYCLDETHSVGEHKARVFLSALGLRREDAGELSAALINAVRSVDCIVGEFNEYGQRYVVNFEMDRNGRKATIRSVWIVETGTDFPRLVTCFVV